MDVTKTSWGFGGLTVIEREHRNIDYIRNEALHYLDEHHFEGKLVFADADGFFTKEATECFEYFKDCYYDLIWFGVRGEDENGRPATNADYVNKNLEYCRQNNDFGALRYNAGPVWGEFIDMRLILSNNIWFQEIETCEDTLFSAKIGHFSGNQYVTPSSTPELYVYVQRKGSLVMTTDKHKAKVGFEAAYDTTRWLKERTEEGYYWTQYNVIWHWMNWCQRDKSAWKVFPKVYNLCEKKVQEKL